MHCRPRLVGAVVGFALPRQRRAGGEIRRASIEPAAAMTIAGTPAVTGGMTGGTLCAGRAISRWSGTDQIRRIEIILAGNADEGEQRIAPGISQRRSHAMRGGGLGDGADRPVRGDPFPGGMGQHGGQIDDAGGLIDGGSLYRRDLMLAQGLAHDLETA